MEKHLLEQPFDKFQRYISIKEIIETIEAEEGPARDSSFLDVGGYPGDITAFLPGRRIFFLDTIQDRIPDYIRGNAASLPFKNGSMDIVICSDMLEHLPPPIRPLVLDEMARVGKGWILVGCPIKLEEIECSEKIVGNFHKALLSKEHPWLKEHSHLGLPREEFLHEYFSKKGLACLDIPNGNLLNWLFMMLVNEYINSIPENQYAAKAINHYFNLQFSHTNRQVPVYRYIHAIHPEAEKVRNLKENLLKKETPPPSTFNILSFLKSLEPEKLASDISTKRDLYEDGLRKELGETRLHIKSLECAGMEKENHISNLRIMMEEKQRALLLLIEENNNKQNAILELGRENQKKQTAIMELQGSNNEKQAAIENLQAAINEKQAAIENLQEYIKQNVWKDRLKETRFYKHFFGSTE
ncbi:MAG: methyltransferase domain-containing protein [Nitrospinae bacterium]|nr:methyltransferase domain-containing protein [Nitrospinota bacterium]